MAKYFILILAILGISVLALTPKSLQSKSIKATSYTTTTAKLQIISPINNSYMNNNVSVLADINNISNNNYNMFWYVDNGQWNWMANSTNQNTKQAIINVGNWNWHNPSKIYTIDLVAVIKSSGQRIYSSVTINIGNNPGLTTTTSTTSSKVIIPSPSPTKPNKTITATPISTQALYANPNNEAALTAATVTNPSLKSIMNRLANTPTATWFGNWNTNIQHDVNSLITNAANVNKIPVLVAYNIPQRDCNSYSAGGATSATAYQTWIKEFAAGIGSRNAIVILEPDALAQISCLSPAQQAVRYQLLNFAVTTLKNNQNTKVYIDAGNPSWISATTMAQRLINAGIAKSNGFSLNVSNFISTSSNIAYGNQISSLVGNKHFVIDTSRNGNGTNNQWCNPQGRALGQTPTANTGSVNVDYFLWIKTPGESDGTCNGGPSAGTWWPSYAETLALNAGW